MSDGAAELTASEIVCPRETSSMTPCVGRDGHLALADDGACVGCGLDGAGIADELTAVIRRYVALRSKLDPGTDA